MNVLSLPLFGRGKGMKFVQQPPNLFPELSGVGIAAKLLELLASSRIELSGSAQAVEWGAGLARTSCSTNGLSFLR